MSEGIITRRIKTPKPLLLDSFPNSAAAYSLRSLKLSGRNKPVVKVRRDSDDAEQDFSPAEINDGSLLTFVGNTASDNGFVTTWYDQSGNGNDATQSTAASQPKIVSAGSLVVENGKVALDFDGSDDGLVNTTLKINPLPFSIFTAINIRTAPSTRLIIDQSQSSTAGLILGIIGGNYNYYYYPDKISIDLDSFASGASLLSLFLANGSQSFYKDGVQTFTDTSAITNNPVPTNDFVIGFDPDTSGRNIDALYSEIIIYLDDQSSNRTGIESNINNHYGIY